MNKKIILKKKKSYQFAKAKLSFCTWNFDWNCYIFWFKSWQKRPANNY